LLFFFATGQSLSDYQWQNRLLLVVTNKDDQNTRMQLALMGEYNREVQDRKLIIIKVLPNGYYNDQSEVWVTNSALYSVYSSKKSAFQIFLIGLDGRVKLRTQHPVHPKEIFELIDQMPIRKRELDEQSKN